MIFPIQIIKINLYTLVFTISNALMTHVSNHGLTSKPQHTYLCIYTIII